MAKKPLNIANALIRFRNFSGKRTDFNDEGKRNFCVFLNDQDARMLAAEGWNVKYRKAREEGEAPQAYIQVAVRFDNYPPDVWMISNAGKSRTLLNEETIKLLDTAEIENADLVINPSYWEKNGRSGTKAYLKSAYITIAEDAFADKYRDFDVR